MALSLLHRLGDYVDLFLVQKSSPDPDFNLVEGYLFNRKPLSPRFFFVEVR
jgi:hypothetical protein